MMKLLESQERLANGDYGEGRDPRVEALCLCHVDILA
jgi:hypothetical protein